jgi:hypothetical protein
VQRTGATESSEEQSSTAGGFFAGGYDQKTKSWRSMLRHYKRKQLRGEARRSPVVLHDGKPSYLVIGRISTVSRWLGRTQALLEERLEPGQRGSAGILDAVCEGLVN